MKCDIEDIYVDLIIEKLGSNQNISTRRKSDPIDSMKVTSYKQIFLGDRGKLNRIYLRGKGGLGKTTFCRKVVHSWCNAHQMGKSSQNSERKETSDLKDEGILLMFDVLLYISLKEVSLEKDFTDAILAQFPSQFCPSKSSLSTFLEVNGERVLFVLDGLDELSPRAKFMLDIVNRKTYHKCCFFISSRPWKLCHMELYQDSEIDLLLSIEGFNWENAMQFAARILDRCYGDKNAIQQFHEAIRSHRFIKELVHVPLLLLFLVHLWYKHKKSFPKKLHEIYLLIVDLLIGRYQGKYENNTKRRPKKCHQGANRTPFPEKITKTSLVQTFGDCFLASLCDVASHFLLSEQKETSLVFDEKLLIGLLGSNGKQTLEIALDIGILSKLDSMSYLARNTSVCFLHKTIQELFTALSFCSCRKYLEIFLDDLKTLNDVFQKEKVVIFLVGISPLLGNTVLEKICTLCDTDEDIIQYREEGSDNRMVVDMITQLYLQCMEEVKGQDTCLKISDLSLNYKHRFDLHHIMARHSTSLKSLSLFLFDCDNTTEIIDLSGVSQLKTFMLHGADNCALYLPESCTLSLLVVSCSQLTCDCSDLLQGALTRHTKLQTLRLEYIDLKNCLLDLSNMSLLSDLTLKKVTLSRSCSNIFGRTLKNCTQLKTLVVEDTDLHDCRLDLSKMKLLSKLVLGNVAVSKSSCKMMGKTLKQCNRLKKIKLANINLQNCRLDLSDKRELSVLTMDNVKMSNVCCESLGKTMMHCSQMKIVRFQDTNLQNCRLNLSYMRALSEFKLKSVALSESCCKVLGKTLEECIQLQTLSLKKTDLQDCVLDLSKLAVLQELTLHHVTLSGGCCDVLAQSLSHCTQLRILRLKKIDLHRCQLNMSGLRELHELTLKNVRLSSECCNELGRTIPFCAELKTLRLQKTDLQSCQLDLSKMSSLQEVKLEKVKLSYSCCEVMGKTLMCCTQLRALSLRRIDLHNCKIDLSNMKELCELTIEKVTLSRNCCDALGRSLQNCTKLKTLRLKDTDLHNCRLDLSSMTVLSELTLEKVTLCGSHCNVLGRILNHCN